MKFEPSRLSPILPLIAIVIVGYINTLGIWPALRQQDTSILHRILSRNPEALKGLSKVMQSPGSPSLMQRLNPQRNYLTLENMNLSGLDLSSSDLREMSLENVNLAGAHLVNTDFSCTDLTNVNFSGARLMHSRFDYSRCEGHISTRRLQCSKHDYDEVSKNTIRPNVWRHPDQNKISCLEGHFVGADFTKAQIRGDRGRRNLSADPQNCEKLLLLVGDMSGAVFKETKLTCVALIHRLPNSSPPKSDQSMNGISFKDARLDRVAFLKGPFKFTQFERANLMGLFLNMNPGQAELDYSRFNEIRCSEKNRSCLVVQQDKRVDPLRLNFLWSKVVTNLQPFQKDDKFICTPPGDLPAWVGDHEITNADYRVLLANRGKVISKLLTCPPSNLLPLQKR